MTPIEELMNVVKEAASLLLSYDCEVLAQTLRDAAAVVESQLANDEDETLMRQLAASVEDNGRKKERAAVVAWLRDEWDEPALARDIEAGNHIPKIRVVK